MRTAANVPAIVLAAFGASSPVARKVYQNIEARLRDAYPDHLIVWAYLSHHIINKQRKLGVVLPTLPETLLSLKSSGFDEAIVQPLLIVPGEEFAIVKSIECAGMKLEIGAPLLNSAADIDAALAAIAPLVQQDIPNILVCHGNKKYSEYNEPLLNLAEAAEKAFDNLVVASVEGQPGTEPLARAREMAMTHDAAVFIPFMMVAGEHITKDVMGDDAGSWKNIVRARQSTCLEPLGRNESILDIFLNHIEVAMQNMQRVKQYD